LASVLGLASAVRVTAPVVVTSASSPIAVVVVPLTIAVDSSPDPEANRPPAAASDVAFA